MSNFKVGDKVKVIRAGLDSYGYADKIGQVFTLAKQLNHQEWLTTERSDRVLGEDDIELVQDEKERISKFLKENKWFIRTGSPEKSVQVQKWLFDHGVKWQWSSGFNINSGEKFLTNTYDEGTKHDYILFSTDSSRNIGQEIKIEFETTVKSVQLPEMTTKKTEAQLKLEELERTIEEVQRHIAKLKEEIK